MALLSHLNTAFAIVDLSLRWSISRMDEHRGGVNGKLCILQHQHAVQDGKNNCSTTRRQGRMPRFTGMVVENRVIRCFKPRLIILDLSIPKIRGEDTTALHCGFFDNMPTIAALS